MTETEIGEAIGLRKRVQEATNRLERFRQRKLDQNEATEFTANKIDE